MNLPAISCLCHTKNNKSLLERAIRCFKAQTYPKKDLLVIFEEDNLVAPDVLSAINDESISSLRIPTNPKLTLGEMRNIGVQQCKGDFFCVWDDDDWFHCQRLEHQMNSILLSHKPATMLSFFLMFDTHENQAYLSRIRLYEASLLCNKAVFKDDIMYAPLSKGEDTHLADKLASGNLVFPHVMPQLYVYTYHGSNTWDRGHFEFLFKYAQKLSEESSFLVKDILNNKISEKEGSYILSSPSFLKPLRYVR